tara:strand:+ start:1561 stop:2364 length:804 start_codon:yes stop_codon:yes gene_type:complete
MELSWIEDFIALNETRNFTLAARKRNSTQPAFSRRIQNLENWLGAILYDRDARPVALTAAGQEFEKRALRLRDDMMEARRAVSITTTNLPDAVTIYTTNTIAIGFLPHWIADNNIKSYRLVVSSVTSCLDAIRQERCDYALIHSFEGLEEHIPSRAMVIGHDRLVFAGNATQDVKILNNMIHGNILMYSPKTAFGRSIEEKMKAQNLSLALPPLCESASAEALMAQVRAGLGHGWVVNSLIGDHDAIIHNNEIFDIPFDILLIQSKP